MEAQDCEQTLHFSGEPCSEDSFEEINDLLRSYS